MTPKHIQFVYDSVLNQAIAAGAYKNFAEREALSAKQEYLSSSYKGKASAMMGVHIKKAVRDTEKAKKEERARA